MEAAPSPSPSTHFRLLKSMRPTSRDRRGMNRSFTRELTMALKAVAIITPTAMSMTLPLKANFLKSSHSFFMGHRSPAFRDVLLESTAYFHIIEALFPAVKAAAGGLSHRFNPNVFDCLIDSPGRKSV